VRALRFEEPAAQAAFEHLLGAYFVRDSQLSAIDRQIEELNRPGSDGGSIP